MDNPWDKLFQDDEFLRWDIHPEIGDTVALFKKRGVRRILDLGCGAGRHVVYLAEWGFEVVGSDISPTGLSYAMKQLHEKNLKAALVRHDMVSFPFGDNSFDAVISIQVIHHNKINDIKSTINEMARV